MMASENQNELKRQVDDLQARNEMLTKTLKESRDQLIELQAQVEKLGLPPNNFAVFDSLDSEGLARVNFNSRVMRVSVSPDIDSQSLQRGQLVILNDSLQIVDTGDWSKNGQLATFLESINDAEVPRVLVKGNADEVHAVTLSAQIQQANLRFGDNLLCDLRAGYAFEQIARSEIDDLLLEVVPDIRYEDIGGLETQIERIVDAVELPFLHASLYADYSLKAPKGILLYGPPGCGKTLIAKAVANSIARKTKELSGQGSGASYFINIKGPELLNKYVGETERQIRTIFERARQRAEAGSPVIVFFDEMDALFRTRGTGISSDVENTVVAQLLSEIDGVEGLEHVIVIGASNREDMIDPAILRPGRLDVKIRIDRPDVNAAKQIFGKYLTTDVPIHQAELISGKSTAEVITRLIDQTVAAMYEKSDKNLFLEVTYASGEKEMLYFSDFNSGAMIENIVSRAKKEAIKEEIASGQRGVKLAHLLKATREEFQDNEDLPNTTNPDDWAKISGRKGQQIVYMRTLNQSEHGEQFGRTITTS